MTSSRSDVVTQCVRVSVCSCVPFFSFSVIGVLSSPKEFQWCFKKVCLKFLGVLRKLQGCFKEVLRVFTKSFKEV